MAYVDHGVVGGGMGDTGGAEMRQKVANRESDHTGTILLPNKAYMANDIAQIGVVNHTCRVGSKNILLGKDFLTFAAFFLSPTIKVYN